MCFKYYIILLSLFITSSSYAGDKPVNYEHKKMIKALEKINKSSDYRLEPLDDFAWKEGQFFKCVGNGLKVAYVYVGRVYNCRTGACDFESADWSGDGVECFDYAIMYGKNAEVLKVHVLEYNCLYGRAIMVPAWLQQFTGHHGAKPLVLGKQVDAQTGATISSGSIVKDVKRRSEQVLSIVKV